MNEERNDSDFWTRQAVKTTSPGNMKIGKTMNVSLLPAVTCPAGVPCWKKCYAMKAIKQYPEVLKRWYVNTVLWFQAPDLFRSGLEAQIGKASPKFFRWHVAGDIPSREYLDMMRGVAATFPKVQFLAHTKAYDILLRARATPPRNLKICISGWPGYRPKAYEALLREYSGSMVELKGQPCDLPFKTCPGSCLACRLCYTSLKPSQGVIFHEH